MSEELGRADSQAEPGVAVAANETSRVEGARVVDARASPAVGERGWARVALPSSLQAKVQQSLGVAVIGVLGVGFLVWYYAGLAERPTERKAVETAKAKSAVRGEMKLPELGPDPAPPRAVVASSSSTGTALVEEGSAEAAVLLAAKDTSDDYAAGTGPSVVGVPNGGAVNPSSPPRSPERDPMLQRRLDGPVLVRGPGALMAEEEGETSDRAGVDALGGGGTASESGALAAALRPTVLRAVRAGVLPAREFLLGKGTVLDCTLETAIDSSLPGLTSCVLATEVWSTDGSRVLLERGTRLIGETRGELRTGQRRLQVLWSEARTPGGVVVALASPGTDALGRAGLTGEVDTRFAARFGAAMLISVLDAAAAAWVASQQDGDGSVMVSTQGGQQIATEVLRDTVAIPPVIRVAHGTPIAVLVARDADFESVYRLAQR